MLSWWNNLTILWSKWFAMICTLSRTIEVIVMGYVAGKKLPGANKIDVHLCKNMWKSRMALHSCMYYLFIWCYLMSSPMYYPLFLLLSWEISLSNLNKYYCYQKAQSMISVLLYIIQKHYFKYYVFRLVDLHVPINLRPQFWLTPWAEVSRSEFFM